MIKVNCRTEYSSRDDNSLGTDPAVIIIGVVVVESLCPSKESIIRTHRTGGSVSTQSQQGDAVTIIEGDMVLLSG